VTVFDDGRVDYQFAPGPPCETAYEPVDTDAETSAEADEGQV
jgi:hypothetical protein